MAILPFVGDAATGAKYVGKYADDVAEFGIKGYNKSKGLLDNKYWTDVVEFKGNTVYKRNDLFDPQKVSTWKSNKIKVEGTNIQRMSSGRSPLGYDNKPINLHHTIQTQTGPIAEVAESFHKKHHKTLHVNTSDIPSGINRSEFNKWRKDYWINRADDFIN